MEIDKCCNESTTPVVENECCNNLNESNKSSSDPVVNINNLESENIRCIKLLLDSIANLEERLKIVEEDRDSAKYISGAFTALGINLLEIDNLDPTIKEQILATIEDCSANFIKNK